MRFVPLSRAEGYDFPENTFDVRGWEVRTALDREKIGKVDDILVDDGSGRPRYLDVNLGLFKKHVLVPLSQARVDGNDDVVWVDGLAKDQFEYIPEYTRDPRVISPDYETRLGQVYHDATMTTTDGIDRVDDRAVEAGGVRRLARLSDLSDFRVAKGDTDPRGWDVITGDGHRIGKVTELIVDTNTMEARYMDTDVDERKLDLERVDRHILVPIDAARLDRGRKHVVVDGLFSKDLGAVPVYSGLPLTSDTEDQIRTAYRVGPRRVTDTGDARAERVADRLDDGSPLDRFYASRVRRREQVDALDRTERIGDDERVETLHSGEAATLREGEEATLSTREQEVRIRLSGDDIIIEKRPRS
jgi:hypothetical protein